MRLRDLSRGGALFEMEKSPTEHQTALLGLETLRETSCVEVKVVRINRARRTKYRVHVAFTEACPDEFYAAALYGPESRGWTLSGDSRCVSESLGPDEMLCHA